ncbi:hypothetical protein Tco_1053406 [Tanacetum coccineum]
MTHQRYNLKTASYDQLFDTLSQFKPHFNASKAKKGARNHDPLALVSHSNVHSSHSHATPSYSYTPQPYYVTLPSSVTDYEEDYQGELQGDAQEDKLTNTMMLLARAITQHDTLEELTVALIMMARIQPAGDKGDVEPKYDVDAVSEKKISSDFKDVQANLLKRIKILEIDFKRSQAQSIDFELKLQHQKDKMASDVSWKSEMTKLHDENVLLKTQVEYVVHERENIKLEYQKLFNSIKATRVQHQREISELIENVNQKIYANDDVRSQIKDLLITISKLKEKFKTIEQGMNVNTKFDKSATLGKLLYFRRPESKDTNLKKKVLLNTKSKSTSTNVKKFSSSVSVVSNKRETLNSTVCQSNANVLKAKTVNAVNDGLNIVCFSCGKHVFMLSHEKCVAHYALSADSRVKRALFTSPVAAKSRNLGATSVVAKSRFSVAKTPTTTNMVSSASSLSPESSQSMTLSNYMKNKIATSREWQKWFKSQLSFNWSPKSKTAQSTSDASKSSASLRTNSKTPVTIQKWVSRHSTLPSVFVSCDAGDLARLLDC